MEGVLPRGGRGNPEATWEYIFCAFGEVGSPAAYGPPGFDASWAFEVFLFLGNVNSRVRPGESGDIGVENHTSVI
jgi:hypothetical protein